MTDLVEILILLLTGCVGGFIAGLLGVGGGAIYVVIFSEYFERKGIAAGTSDIFVKMVIANSVFSVMFAGISGSWKQVRINNFFPKEILLTALPALISALSLSYWLSLSDWYSKERFSVFFVLAILPLIIKTALTKEEDILLKEENKNTRGLMLSGLLSGVVTSFTGLGGGFVVVSIMSGLMRFPIKKSISISLGAMAIVLFVLSGFYFFYFKEVQTTLPFTFGAISLYLTVPVIIGVLIFAPVGVTTAQKLSPKVLRICLLIFFLLIVSRMLIKII